jgi:hypothetical protein
MHPRFSLNQPDRFHYEISFIKRKTVGPCAVVPACSRLEIHPAGDTARENKMIVEIDGHERRHKFMIAVIPPTKNTQTEVYLGWSPDLAASPGRFRSHRFSR